MSQPQLSQHHAFQLLQEFELDPSEYVIFGSGPMFAHGIRPLSDLHDLDIVVKPGSATWQKLMNKSECRYDPTWKCNWIKLEDGLLEFSDGWMPGSVDMDDLFNTAEVVNKFPFASLENVLKWKQAMDRPKDLEHIALIQNFVR